MADRYELSKSEGRIEVRLEGMRVGDDLQVTISGGDWPHIGAVAVSSCHPSLKDPETPTVTTSVVTVTGHKEDLLAREAAQRIAAGTGQTTCVSCGIHLDRISRAEIAQVEKMVEALVAAFLDRLSAG